MESNRARLLGGTVALFLALLAFQSSLDTGLVFDDMIFWRDTNCWRIDSWSEVIGLPFVNACSYRPVRYMSLAVDYLLWGREIYGYHLTNLLLHGTATLLVYRFVLRYIGDVRAAAIAATLWALHPVQTDTVTYLAGRRDLLVTVFYLASILCWPRIGAPLAERVRGTVLAAVFFLLSLFSKEMAVTIPAIVLLMHAYLPIFEAARQGRPVSSPWSSVLRLLWRYFIPFSLITGASIVVVIWYIHTGNVTNFSDNIRGGTIPTHIATVLSAFGRYAELIVFPMRLVGDYSAFPVATSFVEPSVIAGAAFVSTIWGGGIALATRAPWLSFGLLFFGVTMLPVSQIIPHHELLAEHYLYLPLVGLAVPVGRGLELALAAGRRGQVVLVAAALVAGAYGARIQERNRDFGDELRFTERVLAHFPNSQRARLQMANAERERGNLPGAIDRLGEVVQLATKQADNYYVAHMNLANSYAALGKFDLAEQNLNVILDDFPFHPQALRVLSTIRVEQGRGDEVLPTLRMLAKAQPMNGDIQLDTAITLIRMNRFEEAEPFVERAALVRNEDPYALFQAGIVAARLNKLDRARDYLLRSLEFDPKNPVTIVRLAWVEGNLGNQERANELARMAVALQPQLSKPGAAAGSGEGSGLPLPTATPPAGSGSGAP